MVLISVGFDFGRFGFEFILVVCVFSLANLGILVLLILVSLSDLVCLMWVVSLGCYKTGFRGVAFENCVSGWLCICCDWCLF